MARFVALVFWLGSTAGCGVEAEDASSVHVELSAWEAAVATGEEIGEAGLSVNGLSVNGLSVNGLSVNGLSVNGLSVNGLASDSFKGWFEEDPFLHAIVMKYVVLCAVPLGQTRTYTSAVTGQAMTWPGLLGLAPRWSEGSPPTLAEQQVISACLGAHTNKFGINIYVSVLGRNAEGAEVPYTSSELASYAEPEACFFGNAFTGEGVFAASDRNRLTPEESSPRACGLSAKKRSVDCEPMEHVGTCKDFCTLDASKKYYTQCTYNGVTYKPVTTRMRAADIYRCGDGVCQFTEKCGTDTTYDSCYADCGACAP